MYNEKTGGGKESLSVAGDLMMQPGHIPPVSFFVLQAIHSKTGCLCRSRTAKGKG